MLSGFRLAVTKGGHRSYIVSYRADGRSAACTLKHASRSRRTQKRPWPPGRRRQGGDPLTERRKAERARAKTLQAIVDAYVVQERRPSAHNG